MKTPARRSRASLQVASLVSAVGLVLLAVLSMLSPATRANFAENQYLSLISSSRDNRIEPCAVAVMPVGDSITQGYGDPQMAGYRRELYRRLIEAGYAINFVGSRQAGLMPDYDWDNESHPGEEVYYIRDHMLSYLQANHPDIILLHIGTNGINYKAPEVVAAEIDEILTNIYSFDRDIMVVLTRIINRTGSATDKAKITRLNELIQQLSTGRIDQGDPLAVVDMESILTYTHSDNAGGEVLVDMYDYLHPNETGYKKMAVVWDAALQGYLQSYCSTPHPARITSAPVITAYVTAPYTYKVDASGNPAPIFSLAESPGGMAIDSQSGLLAWTPAAAGDFPVVVEASNGVAAPAGQSFVIHVAETADCPEEAIAYYHLDERSVPFADVLGGPPATCTDCPTATAGQVNGAQQFDGVADGLILPNSGARFDWHRKQSFSIEFWIRRPGSCAGTTANYNEVVVGRVDSSSNMAWWVGVSCADQGRARFVLRDSDADNSDDADAISQTIVTGGDWHHVAGVRDWPGIDIRLYVDGELEGQALGFFSSDFTSAAAPVSSGWLDVPGGFYFEGTIDELAIYDRALTAEEIRLHAAVGLHGKAYCQAD